MPCLKNVVLAASVWCLIVIKAPAFGLPLFQPLLFELPVDKASGVNGAMDVKKIPQRLVSLNLCIDQLLWQLVPHERLVSLSYLSAEPQWSPIAAEVKGKAINHGLAEEIMPLHADKILAMPFDSPASVQLLRRLGAPVDIVDVPVTLADIPRQILQLGVTIGAEQKANVMAQAIHHQLHQLDKLLPHTQGRTAFWYASNGIVVGSETMEHELMVRSGLRNLAAERGIQGFGALDIELLLAAKPELLIIEESDSEAYSLAHEYLAHPALDASEVRIIRLPVGLSGCAASTVYQVAEVLQKALSQSAD